MIESNPQTTLSQSLIQSNIVSSPQNLITIPPIPSTKGNKLKLLVFSSILLAFLLFFSSPAFNEKQIVVEFPDNKVLENFSKTDQQKQILKYLSSTSFGLKKQEISRYERVQDNLQIQTEQETALLSKNKQNKADQSQLNSNNQDDGQIQLETLTIANSTLKDFSYDSPSLQVLIFDNNPKLVDFANSSLPRLKTLIIKSTNFRSFSNYTLGNLNRFEIINSSLVGDIPSLDLGIEELVVKNNNFTKADLNKFTKLKKLVIEEEKIQMLDLNISTLESLNLSSASLNLLALRNSLLTEIGGPGLSKLRNLLVENSKMTSFNNYQYQLLQKITFKNSRIGTIENNSLPILSHVALDQNSNNKISINNLPFLKQLTISSSNLTTLNLNNLPLLQSYLFECSNLNSLTVNNINRFSLGDLIFSKLVKLQINNTLLTNQASKPLQVLKSLKINSCNFSKNFSFIAPFLNQLDIQNSNLTYLNLNSYPAVQILQLDLHLLEQLIILNNLNISGLNLNPSNLPKLKKLSVSSILNPDLILSGFQQLEYLHVGKGELKYLEIETNSSSFKDLIVDDNPLDRLTVILATTLRTFRVNISYQFFNFMELRGFRFQGFSNLSAYHLASMSLEYVDFQDHEPIVNIYKNILKIRIFQSNIQLFNSTKFDKNLRFTCQHCDSLEYIKDNNVPLKVLRNMEKIGRQIKNNLKRNYKQNQWNPQETIENSLGQEIDSGTNFLFKK